MQDFFSPAVQDNLSCRRNEVQEVLK